MTLEALEDMLKRAAAADGWTRVVRRCAWCQRTVDVDGTYAIGLSVDEETVVTDGMCPACGAKALAHLAARRAVAA